MMRERSGPSGRYRTTPSAKAQAPIGSNSDKPFENPSPGELVEMAFKSGDNAFDSVTRVVFIVCLLLPFIPFIVAYNVREVVVDE